MKKVLLVLCLVMLTGCVNDSTKTGTFASEEKIESEIETSASEDENSELYQKGEEIGNKLTEELNDIDWEENYEKAREAGKKAAEWLNGTLD